MNTVLEFSSDSYKLLCRACLSPTTEILKFNTKFEDTDLYKIYTDCVAIKVDPNDKLPQNICESCRQKLIEAYTFKKQCEKSDSTLKTVLNKYKQNLNKECTVIVVFENDLQIIKAEDEQEEMVKSENCTLAKQEVRRNWNDEESKLSSNLSSIINNEANVMVASASDRLPEIGKSKPKNMKILVKTLQKRRIYECPHCSKIFTSATYKAHLRTHTKEKPYSCPYCQKRFRLSGNMRKHIMTHTGEKPHVCDICNKGFIQAGSLIEHKRSHTGETPFMCFYCGMQFSRYRQYQIHLEKHKKLDSFDRYQCPLCLTRSPTKVLLKQHLLVHGEKTFLCSYCGRLYFNKNALVSHIRTHHVTNPYTCTECNKSYKHHISLKAHKLIHKGEKPYSCEVCLKNFTQKSHLRNHQKIHTGEKPFVCQFCNKAFAMKGNLKVHIRMHTGETPYVCDVCNKGFYDSTNLRKHQRNHHKD